MNLSCNGKIPRGTFSPKPLMFFFSGGGKEGEGRNEDGGEEGAVTHVTTFRAVRWRML